MTESENQWSMNYEDFLADLKVTGETVEEAQSQLRLVTLSAQTIDAARLISDQLTYTDAVINSDPDLAKILGGQFRVMRGSVEHLSRALGDLQKCILLDACVLVGNLHRW